MVSKNASTVLTDCLFCLADVAQLGSERQKKSLSQRNLTAGLIRVTK